MFRDRGLYMGISLPAQVVKAMRAICREHGGPRQYLQHTYSDEGSRCDFVTQMLKLLPLAADVEYFSETTLPMVAQEDFGKARPPSPKAASHNLGLCMKSEKPRSRG